MGGVGQQHTPYDMSGLDDELAPVAPSAERVARRALVLAAMAARSYLEGEGPSDDSAAFQRDMLRWLADVGAAAECEARERRVLDAPIGTLSRADAVNGSWDAEGLVVLAWALGCAELPAFDEECMPREVADALGFWQPRAETVLAAPALRAGDEIETLAERLLAVHWRLREYSLNPVPLDFPTFALRASFGPLDVSGLPFVEGDLAIDGVPLGRVPEERWRACLSIAGERHRAANWLLGFEELYSEVTADT